MARIKIDVDIMVDNGETFYGRVRTEILSRWKMKDGELIEYADENDVYDAVLKKLPTLKNKEFTIIHNN